MTALTCVITWNNKLVPLKMVSTDWPIKCDCCGREISSANDRKLWLTDTISPDYHVKGVPLIALCTTCIKEERD